MNDIVFLVLDALLKGFLLILAVAVAAFFTHLIEREPISRTLLGTGRNVRTLGLPPSRSQPPPRA